MKKLYLRILLLTQQLAIKNKPITDFIVKWKKTFFLSATVGIPTSIFIGRILKEYIKWKHVTFFQFLGQTSYVAFSFFTIVFIGWCWIELCNSPSYKTPINYKRYIIIWVSILIAMILVQFHYTILSHLWDTKDPIDIDFIWKALILLGIDRFLFIGHIFWIVLYPILIGIIREENYRTTIIWYTLFVGVFVIFLFIFLLLLFICYKIKDTQPSAVSTCVYLIGRYMKFDLRFFDLYAEYIKGIRDPFYFDLVVIFIAWWVILGLCLLTDYFYAEKGSKNVVKKEEFKFWFVFFIIFSVIALFFLGLWYFGIIDIMWDPIKHYWNPPHPEDINWSNEPEKLPPWDERRNRY